MAALDYNVLSDIFSLKKKKCKPVIIFNGRRVIVERFCDGWEGIFMDDHSVTYYASTKRDLLLEMKADA